jgi:hypothetical protein
MKTAKIAKMVLAALLVAGTGQVAWAHGDAVAKHGGIVKNSDDVGYELVVKPDGADLYVYDHEQDMQTAKLTGKLTVLNGTTKSEVPLTPAGGNRMEAKGVKIVPGAKVVAALVAPDRATAMTVRFNVK